MRPLTLAHLTLGASPIDTVEAAAGAGFVAAGLRICARRPNEPYPATILGDRAALLAVRRRAEDLGVRLSNVSAHQFYPDVDWTHLAPVVEATARLGSPMIVANSFEPDEARFIALLARYCAEAAGAGIRIALEFLPYSAVRTLDDALRVIRGTGAANAGLMLDVLHLNRSGGSAADIARVPPERLFFAQLCDARPRAPGGSPQELMAEARTARLTPGEGALPLYDFLDALPDDLEIEWEIARADMAARPPLEKARIARADSDRYMAAYEAHRRGLHGRA